MKRIVTDRLVLEPVGTENASTLWKIMQSGGLREFQDVPRHTRDEFARRVASRPKQFDSRAIGRFEWLIVVAETREAAGWVSLRVGDHARGTAEIGYSLLAPFRGSGFAAEAARGIVRHAFVETDLKQIDACCVPQNVASRALLAAVGFEETRVQKNGAIVRGRPVDIVIFEMTRESYDARNGAALRKGISG
ncbi:MAG: GNAT family N-acetyltransferase [Candidatus Eremiobacteraeota bacterium]|nr:GNAT family N-acetyltransferase [Candidatus Eremiobacteraeota bacterium]